MSSTIWGPFDTAPEAAGRLCKFTDAVLDPGFGVAWLNDGRLYALRAPRFDNDGNGQIITYGVRPAPAPSPPPPQGAGARLKAWFWRQMAFQGEMAMQESEANLAMGQAIDKAISTAYRRAVGKDREDTKGIAFDVAAVAISAFLLLTGTAEVVGIVAAVGGVALLVMDGAAYGTELAGDDEAADKIKDITFPFRCLAMLATLPDAAWNVGKVLAEGGKIAAEAARIDTTVSRATADAARSTRAASSAADMAESGRASARAQKYAAIGERARLKAVAARQKLAAFLTANAAGRALIVPSTALLVKEVKEDSSQDWRGETNTWLSRYVFHVSSVHREKRA